MKKTRMMFCLLFIISFIVGCSENSSLEDEGEDQILNLTEFSQIASMDSVMATDDVSFQWLNETMEGLYRLDASNQPVPAIARKAPRVSDDGLIFNITLRDDAFWSNGDPVTAHDFVFAWRRLVDPNVGSEYGPFMLSGVIKNAEAISNGEAPVDTLGVVASDDFHLKITLEKPVPYFHSLLTFGTFLPQNKAYVEAQGSDYALSSEQLIYNGPFILTDWSPTGENPNQWKLVKNDAYWDQANVKLSEINVSVVKEVSSAVNLYEAGEVDRISLSSEYVTQYRTHEDFLIQKEPNVLFLKLNQNNKYLSDINVRKAISMAIDKESFVDVVLNDGSSVLNALLPGDFINHPESGEDFREINGDLLSYDLEQAKIHWEKALETFNTDSIELELLGSDTDVSRQALDYFTNQLQTNLKGLELTVITVPFEERLARNGRSAYEIQFVGQGPDYLDGLTFLERWTSTSAYMFDHYKNPSYDQLIEEAENVNYDLPTARFQNFLDAEQILMEDAVIAPIYQRALPLLVRQSVKGVIYTPVGPDYSYKYAYIEE